MHIEKREIFRAIAEMAYVIAKADKGLSSEERMAFHKIVEEELDYESWAAQSRFELLDEVTQPSIDKAYNEAMHDFRKYKDHLTDELKRKIITVMQKVAEACSGLSDQEALIIDRVKKDLQQL
ncbi:MAG: TerB family tellurite resistance protein [Cyclobacteriaceae bacterium]|nr:TerB family tellurite resistance protein [Cyclobacteriaceae bacterium]